MTWNVTLSPYVNHFQEPLFVGMETIDFLKNDDEQKFTWVNFSNRVIPFLTDLQAKKLVRQNMKGFEKSKVLNSIRMDSSPLLRAEKDEEKQNIDNNKRRPSDKRIPHISIKSSETKLHLKVLKQQKLRSNHPFLNMFISSSHP
jgi:hypothetical protein